MSISRYFHTLRYLRPVQIYGRLWFRLNPAKPDTRSAPSLRRHSGEWLFPVGRPASMLGANKFQFLNVIGHACYAADWNDPSREKLWLYNLHYFDDLNAASAKDRIEWHRALIARWVEDNSPGMGNGWESYPTSLRIVNWIKWSQAGNSLDQAWLHSLAVQVRWLRRHIEWHLLGNHLFANAKALVFAGLFFEGDEATEWLAQGLRILRREVPEQVLADGGHFELSPMYHAIVLEDLLDLVNAAAAWPELVPESVVLQWRVAASRMLRWLVGMVHPDGGIAFFNDAAFGIAPDYAELLAYAGRLGIVTASDKPTGLVTHFADTGYIRLARGNAVALLDVAQVGSDYLPGHAHADTLSFEFSLFGQRVVVNSGTSRYGIGPERLRQRGTAAHSTVQVDGVDSSEVWGGFRVARRARPFGLEIVEDDVLSVSCAHDGYMRLRGHPVHRRCWQLAERSLKVIDTIEGDFHEAVARYHLHPSAEVINEGEDVLLRLPEGREVRCSLSGGIFRVASGSWHPEFGLSVPCSQIEVLFTGHQAGIAFAWN
jgi:uncharacterized heparinase superfamily protein